ncbi:ribonuclease III domain-containing protein [Paenibacillus sp. UMB4589-SE434]|nr:ribonuclease III domain-containing protein [Paenibacillus sp. UMB4589-SE434]
MKGAEVITVDEERDVKKDDWLFDFAPAKGAKLLNPIALAYMGDAIYEIAVRQYVIAQPNHRPHHMHQETIKYVSAKAQAKFLNKLAPMLTEEEADVVRQGRNAKSTVPKSANVQEYRHATALEALFGYLYYEKQLERLQELVHLMLKESENEVG